MTDHEPDQRPSRADRGDPDVGAGAPEPGTDSRVEDWFGQSVADDAELADELVAEHGVEEAERRFDQQAAGRDVQDRRRGDEVDPDLGEHAYRVDRRREGVDEPDGGPLARARAGLVAIREATTHRGRRADTDSVADGGRLLHLYLRDHHAADVAGLALAHRVLRSNVGTSYEDDLTQLVRDIEDDSRVLRIAMAELGVEPSPVRMLVARGSELVSRLKANGRLITYSPSSRVLELEGLVGALSAKQQFWRSLAVAGHEAVPASELERLIERAADQVDLVIRLHDQAAAAAFAA